jgi:hypothetical protein
MDGQKAFPALAVQITQGKDNDPKIRAFRSEAAKWPGIGALIYVEIEGVVSDAMCKTLKISLLEMLDEIKRSRGKILPQRRIRIYESGEFQWIPLGQN